MLLPSSSGVSCGRARNIFIAAVVAGLVLLPSATAWADWVLGAYVGNAATLSSTVVLTQPDRQTELEIAGVEYRGESFKFPLYYGYRVTWIPDRYRWLGIEAEYIHAKVFSQTDQSVNVRGTLDGVPVEGSVQLSSIVQRLAMSHGLNFFFGSVAVRRELGFVDSRGTPRLVAIARVGAGPTMPHTEVTIGSEHVDQDESGGLGMQVGGGLQFAVWEGVGVVGGTSSPGRLPRSASLVARSRFRPAATISWEGSPTRSERRRSVPPPHTECRIEPIRAFWKEPARSESGG